MPKSQNVAIVHSRACVYAPRSTTPRMHFLTSLNIALKWHPNVRSPHHVYRGSCYFSPQWEQKERLSHKLWCLIFFNFACPPLQADSRVSSASHANVWKGPHCPRELPLALQIARLHHSSPTWPKPQGALCTSLGEVLTPPPTGRPGRILLTWCHVN